MSNTDKKQKFTDWFNSLKPQYRMAEIIYDYFKCYPANESTHPVDTQGEDAGKLFDKNSDSYDIMRQVLTMTKETFIELWQSKQSMPEPVKPVEDEIEPNTALHDHLNMSWDEVMQDGGLGDSGTAHAKPVMQSEMGYDILKELKTLDSILDGDGFKEWCYVRLALAEATKAMGEKLQSQQAKQPVMQWVKASESLDRLPLEKNLVIKDNHGYRRLGNFFKDGNDINFHVHGTDNYDSYIIPQSALYSIEWLEENL